MFIRITNDKGRVLKSWPLGNNISINTVEQALMYGLEYTDGSILMCDHCYGFFLRDDMVWDDKDDEEGRRHCYCPKCEHHAKRTAT